ncbi:MAG: hypothetical protein H0X03_04275 [Nitrosopumilus sp.]|nr:hypothetical protein [Nitrosopumilus sp.]
MVILVVVKLFLSKLLNLFLPANLIGFMSGLRASSSMATDLNRLHNNIM